MTQEEFNAQQEARNAIARKVMAHDWPEHAAGDEVAEFCVTDGHEYVHITSPSNPGRAVEVSMKHWGRFV